MSPLNILFVYYEPITSGQTVHVLSLVKRLNKNQFSIQVVLPDLLQNLKNKFEAEGAIVYILPIRRLLWLPAAIIGLFNLVRSTKPDIVHIHSQEAGLVARPIAWLAGARNIFYTPQTIDIRRKHFHYLVVLAEKMLSYITKMIISVNETDRKRMMEWGIPENKITKIYNGVDLVEITSCLPPSSSLPQDVPLVIQLGRLSEQKNPLAFVEGAQLVLSEVPDVYFIMIGEGPLHAIVQERIATLGLDDRVKLLGGIPHAATWLGLADLVTLTSLWEGTPYSLIEAMAWGKPVVATNVNGCSEVIKDSVTGYIVPPGRPQIWAKMVIKLLKNPNLAAQMGKEGQQRAELMFSVQKMVDNMADLYEEIAS